MAKFQDLYQQELHKVRQLSKEFAEAHPNVAPMLREQSSDPDVERLLEGFAYISAQIQEIIDDQIPQFSGALINKFFPHYLRPLPSATIMHFKPQADLSEVYKVKKNASFGSIPVNGTTCLFRLCSELNVDPITLNQVQVINNSGEQQYIELSFSLSGIDLGSWQSDQLRFHLGDAYQDACQLYYILMRYVERIELCSSQGRHLLSKRAMVAEGFSDDEAILPYPGHANTSFRILQEYFLMPEKYLYISINGLTGWQTRPQGNQFSIRLYLSNNAKALPEITPQSFLLHTAPAINLFEYDAKPITLNHMQYQYPVQADAKERKHFPIYTIKQVQGYQQGRVQAKQYINIDYLKGNHLEQNTYEVINKSSASGEGLDYYIAILYNNDEQIRVDETLSILLECTNGTLPEYLSKGEINQATGTSPSLLTFENLYVPTTYKTPPEDDQWMWQLQSMLSLNYLSIANRENLCSLLKFYLFLNKGRHVSRSVFERQIDSIEEVKVSTINRMVSGILMRGENIRIKLRITDFSSEGEAFLFISVLDHFFATYVAINSFTLVELIDTATGESILWPMRVGERLLS
ncbi:type VI secretion system baseplate subunit TssF [Thiotrichales bacterium 19S3-7]|nr:type VI secretion system baseplate subunit TssF [Thiotrichales bacterium 19S3-7]MCF6802142.1 type VI secretion system baseplate subunit TssF [Thiotrichales bacterium 19S3-11]